MKDEVMLPLTFRNKGYANVNRPMLGTFRDMNGMKSDLQSTVLKITDPQSAFISFSIKDSTNI